MNADDLKKLDLELCKRWPKKFNADDLRYWRNALRDYALQDVVEALTDFRNNSRFIPKPKEIAAQLARKVGGSDPRTPSALEGSYADVLRKHNRSYDGRSDAEVYCRYWRQMHINATARQMDTAWIEQRCVASLCSIEGMTLEDARRHASFLGASVEMFRTLLDEIRMENPSKEVLEALSHFA